jgi:glycosyltransferase involved in cell wall biosynthesis
MKILYISNAIIPTEMSRSLSIMRVCQALSDYGHEVLLTAIAPTRTHPDPLEYYGLKGGFTVKCDYFGKVLYNEITSWYLIAGLLHALKTIQTLRTFSPDLIYSRLTILELLFVPKDIPIIYEMHSLGPLGQKWWRRQSLLWLMKHKNFKRIIVTTNVLQDWLEKELPDMDVVIARLSAEAPIKVDKKSLSAFKEEHIQGSFSHNIGYTGYRDTYGLRGTDILCQAAAQMPSVGLHIVGGDPEAVEHWKSYAQEWNKHNNIFFYGYRNPAEMPYFLTLLDAVLAPLQFKPNKRAPLGQNMSPLKIPQYMGYKKAIIASDLNAHREILTNGKNALLVEHDNVTAWVNAVTQLLSSPDLRKKMGDDASEIYESEFTPTERIKIILKGII